MNWYLQALRKYATFSERARRSEYWYFTLFYLLIYVGLIIVDTVTGSINQQIGIGILSGLFLVAMLIPSIAVTVRRLHDTNRSGWWLLIALVPLLGGLVLLVFTVLDSEPGSNQWGPSPKAIPGA